MRQFAKSGHDEGHRRGENFATAALPGDYSE